MGVPRRPVKLVEKSVLCPRCRTLTHGRYRASFKSRTGGFPLIVCTKCLNDGAAAQAARDASPQPEEADGR